MPGAAPQIQYRNEFVMAFTQRQTLLRDTTTREAVVKGNQATFLIASSTNTAVTRGVNGRIPYQDNDNAQVTVTIKEKHVPVEMTSFNIFQSQADQRAIMQMNTMTGINRDIDQVILAELANGTLDTGAAATASLLMINKAVATLMNNGCPWDGNVYAVISASFLMYLMSIPSFASADYVMAKPFVNIPGLNASDPKKAGQSWWDWMGVKWIVNSLVSGAGTASEKCFMYHKNAIGHAANVSDIACPIGYDEKEDLSWSRCTLYHEAKLLQNSGVVQMLHDGSAHVAT